jgi:sulfane dehydrogenase subunit SoxC
MDPASLYRRVPLAPHQRHERITPTGSAFVLAHLGIPRFDAADWSLNIDGLVRSPLRLDLAALHDLPQTAIEAFHQCAGAPRDPKTPMRRVINVVWRGVRLRDLLDRASVMPQAGFLWSYGLDHGSYDGHTVDHYIKDLPLDRALADEVLVATGINGGPLPVQHGAPARLIVPGFYGTNSVKWLCRLRLAERRSDGPFTTALYNDPAPGGGTSPVWAVAPECALVAPAPHAVLGRGETTIWGWAWGAAPIAEVAVSIDGGTNWRPAEVESRRGFAWQRFSLAWRPERRGPVTVMARATDANGVTQPLAPARNAVHTVPVEVAAG